MGRILKIPDPLAIPTWPCLLDRPPPSQPPPHILLITLSTAYAYIHIRCAYDMHIYRVAQKIWYHFYGRLNFTKC